MYNVDGARVNNEDKDSEANLSTIELVLFTAGQSYRSIKSNNQIAEISTNIPRMNL